VKKITKVKTASKRLVRHPVLTLASVFCTRRDLARVTVGSEVLGDCELSIKLVDILVDLYGATKLHWKDPQAHHGHVTFRDLLESGVHDDSFSDASLSLRLKQLQDRELLVVEPIPRSEPGSELRSGPRGSRSWVRITPAGVEVAAPIWDRYMKLAESLVEGAPQAVQDAHYLMNKFISKRTKSRSISFEEVAREVERESKSDHASKS
jgi:hypothetical protein